MAELREGQSITVTAAPKTASGHAAKIQAGTAEWVSSDEEIAIVTVNPNNELEATVTGLNGSTNEAVVISLHADGDQDEGVSEIVGTLSVVVTQGNASVFDLSASPARNVETTTESTPSSQPSTTETAPTETEQQTQPSTTEQPA